MLVYARARLRVRKNRCSQCDSKGWYTERGALVFCHCLNGKAALTFKVSPRSYPTMRCTSCGKRFRMCGRVNIDAVRRGCCSAECLAREVLDRNGWTLRDGETVEALDRRYRGQCGGL